MAPLIASAGVIGVALEFGAQNLVRDFLTGIFMLLEDQYGVGDVVDVGDAVGTVETVGLRVTTVRDINGTLWFCRNGEIQRVGNMSQGYAVAVVDLPIAHTANVHQALQVALCAAEVAAGEPEIAEDVPHGRMGLPLHRLRGRDRLEPPEMLGVNTVTAESVVLGVPPEPARDGKGLCSAASPVPRCPRSTRPGSTRPCQPSRRPVPAPEPFLRHT